MVRLPTMMILLALLAGCSRGPVRPEDTPEKIGAPPAFDAAGYAALEQRGIAPPRTVRAGETIDEIDVGLLRSAVGRAEPVAQERLGRLQAAAGGDIEEQEAQGSVVLTAHYDEEELELLDDADESFGDGLPGVAGVAAEAPAAAGPTTPRADRGVLDSRDSDEDAPEDGTGPELPQKLTRFPTTQPAAGKILFLNAEGKYEALVPRAFRAQAFVAGPRAHTIVEYVFSNPTDRTLQGTFHYALPAGATPGAFGMFRGPAQTNPVDDRRPVLLPPLGAVPAGTPAGLPELADLLPARGPDRDTTRGRTLDWGEHQVARVVEHKRAREVYESIVRQNIDPALLEWAGGNTFRARVFPIEPKSVKRVFLAFEQTLPRPHDDQLYCLPLPEDEELGEIEVRLCFDESTLALTAVNGTATEATPAADALWAARDVTFTPGKTEALTATFTPREAGAQVLLAERPGGLDGASFFVRMRPPLVAREQATATGRALFLIDTSLSTDGPIHGLSGELVRQVLERDSTISEYAVLLFDLRPRWLHDAAWRPNDPDQRAATARELDRIYLEGATSIEAVLDELDRQDWIFAGGGPVGAFLVSDGHVTWGQSHVDALLADHQAATKARWTCYEFGTVAANRTLFDALARATAGRTVTVLSPAELPAAALAHRVAPVVLQGVTVAGARATDLVVAGDPRLLYAGQDLVVAGRLPEGAGGAELVVTAAVDGTSATWNVPLATGARSSLGARAWAELHVARLLALDDERLDRMVVALSQRFGLANALASLLVLDTADDWVRYQIEDERVDLADLERLRGIEEDQRRDRLQGIALDGVEANGRELVRLLADVTIPAYERPPAVPLLDRPTAGLDPRAAAEAAYRALREQARYDVETYEEIARVRALSGDTLGSLRAWSCLVELAPADAEAGRLVGYACLALGQYAPAAELFERIRLRRPFEPQSYLEEAMALEAAGRLGLAARNYEIVLAREFPRHQAECRKVAAVQYARLLGGVLRTAEPSAELSALAATRLAELAPQAESSTPVDLQLTMHWNSNDTDIDLWVVEPEGERCFYQNKTTAAGGTLFWDITTGYGPELYQRPRAAAGTYEVLAHFYGNNSARLAVPTVVLLVRDRNVFAPEDQFTRRFQTIVLGKTDAVLSLRKEVW